MRLGLMFALALAAFETLNLRAATIHYVDASGTNPVSPYLTWDTAATNIQDAINHSGYTDTILVTNGVYEYGGFSNSGSNRVYANNNQTILSVNGPAFTVIKGYQVPGTTNGASAVRCVFLQKGTMLSGFTLTNGATPNFNYGGGVYAPGAVVSNCVIINNAAYDGGAGAYQGSLVNCTLVGNTAGVVNIGTGGGANSSVLVNCLLANNFAGYTSGGAANSTLVNCTVVSNVSGAYAGSSWGSTLKNCIVYYNLSYYTNADANPSGSYSNCCVSFPTNNLGANNFTNPPRFANLSGGDYHLNGASPGINAGNNTFMTNTTDLDGNPRIMGGVVDLGAYEFQSPVHYVKTVLFGVTPVSPFTNWVTAATNIQDAVNAANAGDFIIVSNGIYQSGGATQNGYALSNRVAINKAVTVQSVNGAAFTVIAGLPGTGGYPSTGIRCVYLTNGATLAGFTLTNGATDGFGADPVNEQSGAAAWCESTNATISDCVLVHSYASEWGGGAYRGTLNNCVISNDTAFINGGGTYGANLNNCIVSGNRLVQGFGGGGVCFGTLDHCLVSSNSAFMGGGACSNILNYCVVKNNSASTGGGAYYCTMLNCELNNNLASSIGGGAYQSSLVNCTIVSNAASGPSLQPTGGGLYGGRASNCIIYYNLALKDPNVSGTGQMAYCCTTPLPAGPGNLTNAPVFVDLANGDFHLQSSSPCINAGNNAYVSGATDLDGNPRIIGGTVDMGAYEFQSPTTVPFFAALQTPTNNSPGLTITWQSVNGVNYFIQRSGDLAVQPPFATIQSNIIGLPGMTSYTDTGAVGAGPFFYRVGVQP